MATSIRDMVARNIRAARMQAGLSQEKLSEASGLSIRFISRAENQPQNLTIESLETIAEALGVTVADLTMDPSKGLPKQSKKAAEALDQAIKVLQSFRSMLP